MKSRLAIMDQALSLFRLEGDAWCYSGKRSKVSAACVKDRLEAV